MKKHRITVYVQKDSHIIKKRVVIVGEICLNAQGFFFDKHVKSKLITGNYITFHSIDYDGTVRVSIVKYIKESDSWRFLYYNVKLGSKNE